MRTITINVTAEDIGMGDPMKANRCPVACAITKRLLPDNVRVTNREISFSCGADVIKNIAPDNVRKFIRDFDLGHKVRPIKFKVRV